MSPLPIALTKGPRGLPGVNGVQGPTGPSGVNGVQGPTGPSGVNGISSNLYSYKAHSQVSDTPPLGYLYWDQQLQTSATNITLSNLTQLGNAVDLFLSVLKLGDYIVIQSKENSNNFQKWIVSEKPTSVSNSHIIVKVTHDSGTTIFLSDADIIVIVQSISPVGATGPTGPSGTNGVDGTTILALNSVFTGTNTFDVSPIVPTLTVGDNSTKVASTEFVRSAISNITPYIDASGNASGPIHMANNSIDFINPNGGTIQFTATTQSIAQTIIGLNGEYVENYVASMTDGVVHTSRIQAQPTVSGFSTSVDNFEGSYGGSRNLHMTFNETTPTIEALFNSQGGGYYSIPITIKSDLDMDQHTLTNIPSISSSSTLSLTSTGDLTIGNSGIVTDLKGKVKINSSSGSVGQVLTSTGEDASPTWQTVTGAEGPNTVALVTPSNSTTLNVENKVIVQGSTSSIILNASEYPTISNIYNNPDGGTTTISLVSTSTHANISSQCSNLFQPIIYYHGGKEYMKVSNGVDGNNQLELGTSPNITEVSIGSTSTTINASNALKFTLPEDSIATTQSKGNNSRKVATTAYVDRVAIPMVIISDTETISHPTTTTEYFCINTTSSNTPITITVPSGKYISFDGVNTYTNIVLNHSGHGVVLIYIQDKTYYYVLSRNHPFGDGVNSINILE